jgi:hypothetical protein
LITNRRNSFFFSFNVQISELVAFGTLTSLGMKHGLLQTLRNVSTR